MRRGARYAGIHGAGDELRPYLIGMKRGQRRRVRDTSCSLVLANGALRGPGHTAKAPVSRHGYVYTMYTVRSRRSVDDVPKAWHRIRKPRFVGPVQYRSSSPSEPPDSSLPRFPEGASGRIEVFSYLCISKGRLKVEVTLRVKVPHLSRWDPRRVDRVEFL